MVNVRKTCQSCQYWSPVDMTLDAGARIFGTCTKIGDYRTIYEKSRHLAGGDWNKLVEQLKLELRKAVAPEMQALAIRNDNVGEYVMTWWDAVCATAPKPKDDGDMPACAME